MTRDTFFLMSKETAKRNGMRWAVVSGVFLVSFLLAFQAPTPRYENGEITWLGHVVSATKVITVGPSSDSLSVMFLLGFFCSFPFGLFMLKRRKRKRV